MIKWHLVFVFCILKKKQQNHHHQQKQKGNKTENVHNPDTE